MAKQDKAAITPTRSDDYPEWYQQVIKASDLAERSPVRGCMVIKPWGYALWENIVRVLDDMFKDTGVRNAYFPLFIPLSFLEREAEHVEGFAKECAVVSHHRLEKGPDGGLIPAGRLTEPLIVRPTSETIIGDSFSKWISSYRDLPLLINQWANVVRWEMRTRMFLRTSEFLWQEGHTAHATEQEAIGRTELMLDVYRRLVEDHLAIPVIKGKKSAAERFPGAVDTMTIEAMMQDRKALQAGTSHFLGQNFARASDIRFQTAEESEAYAWTTSWGLSTRVIGGVIMTHGDDDGIILPPRVASAQVVLMPIVRKDKDRPRVMDYVDRLADALSSKMYNNRAVGVEVDTRDIGGARGWDWIKKGIPLRVEIGPRDIAGDSVFVARRDKPHRDRQSIPRTRFIDTVTDLLEEIQGNLLERARTYRDEHLQDVDDNVAFYDFFTPSDNEHPEIHGGFARAHWCGSPACEEKIKDDLGVTLRCIPLDRPDDKGPCICCDGNSQGRVIFAKAY
ncbi:Prolyl-tRNA synthetase (EC, archaeal/eukaryal type [Olavius algarvensis associated proteobacterium Delta 3]|nr:Prolyl-tRNA synthetase (EC, archaeal/eukaryal type [Olavius algarvensis associated proteobacterium Delta 3]CAB5145256.1 Prolyl-tRNA synthetase (EC, archaeal/eukaryal type [Olavius algarvensis associated proteobacterium Delta 3]